MASKAMLLVFATVLFVTTRAESHDLHEELKIKATYAKVQVPAPAPPPLVKSPPAKAPNPPAPVIKAPTPPLTKPPTPPVSPLPPVKPPTYAPPKPPTTPVSPVPPVKPPTYPPLPPVKSKKDCIPLCDKRCQLHSRKRLCMRACMTCCDRCKCVPPGTSGNRERCGKCYTEMVTHGNKSKCP